MKVTRVDKLGWNKLIFVSVLIGIISTSGCLGILEDIKDFLGPEEAKLTGAQVKGDILFVTVEVWDRGKPYSSIAHDILMQNDLGLWLNEKLVDFDWKNYPEDFMDKYPPSIEREHFWFRAKYGDGVLYRFEQKDTESGAPDDIEIRSRRHTYLTFKFLLENTTLQQPILVELKKNSEVIGSLTANES